MNQQSGKNIIQRKMEVKEALGGKKINITADTKKKEPIINTTILEQNTKISPPTKRSDKKNEIKQSIKTQQKMREGVFLEKIRPKQHRGKIFKPLEDKKIERVSSQKTSNNKKPDLRTIRTYKGDIADAVKKKGESLAKITIKIKEESRKSKVEKITKNTQPKKSFIITGILVVSILGGLLMIKLNKTGLFLNIFKKTNTTQYKHTKIIRPITTSLIYANKEKSINISVGTNNLTKTIYGELKKIYNVGSIENIYLYKIINIVNTNGDNAQKQKIATTRDLVAYWMNNMPDTLTRSLEKKFMLGIYSTQTEGNTPFLILTTNSYAQTFAGMIKWEKTFTNDFYRLFGIKLTARMNTTFKDEVINGKDTRILTDINGKILILYSFIDKKTIVITTNKESFNGILQKIKGGLR